MSDVTGSSFSESVTALITSMYETVKSHNDALVALAEQASTIDEVKHLANAARSFGRSYTGTPQIVDGPDGLPTVARRNGKPVLAKKGLEQVCFAKGLAAMGVGTTRQVTAAVAPVEVLEDAEPFAN